MKRIEPFEEQFINEDDLKFINESSLDAITQRFTTFYNLPGVVEGLVVRAGTQNDSIIISPGIGYNRNGEEVIVDTTITEFLTNFSTLPPSLTNEYWVKIDFEQIETTPRFHPDTGLGPNLDNITPYYTRLDNGYVLTVDNVEPTELDTAIPLAKITNHLIGNPILPGNIDLTVVSTCNIKRELVEQLDHTTDLTNVGILTHDQIDSKISSLETTAVTLTNNIGALTNSQLGFYISSRIQAHETDAKSQRLTFNLTRGATGNILSWNAGVISTIDNPAGYPVNAGSLPLTGSDQRGYIIVTLNNSGSTVEVNSDVSSVIPGSNKLVLGYCGDNDRLKYWYGSQSPLIISEASATPNELYLTWNSMTAYGFNSTPTSLEINNSNTASYSTSNIVKVGGRDGSIIWLGNNYTGTTARPRLRTTKSINNFVITTLTNKPAHDTEAPLDAADGTLTKHTINIGVNPSSFNDRDDRIAVTGKEIYTRGPVYSPDNQFNQSPNVAASYNSLDDFIYQAFMHDKFQLIPINPSLPMLEFDITSSSSSVALTTSNNCRLSLMPLLLDIDITVGSSTITTDSFVYADWVPGDGTTLVSGILSPTAAVASKTDLNKIFTAPGKIRIPLLRRHASSPDGLITINAPIAYRMLYPYFEPGNLLNYTVRVYPNKIEISITGGSSPLSATDIRNKVLKIT